MVLQNNWVRINRRSLSASGRLFIFEATYYQLRVCRVNLFKVAKGICQCSFQFGNRPQVPGVDYIGLRAAIAARKFGPIRSDYEPFGSVPLTMSL